MKPVIEERVDDMPIHKSEPPVEVRQLEQVAGSEINALNQTRKALHLTEMNLGRVVVYQLMNQVVIWVML